MKQVTIPAGYVACGYTAVAGPGASGTGEIEECTLYLAPADREQDDPAEDPASIALTMTLDTFESMKRYINTGQS